MSQTSTAILLNRKGRVTAHQCARLVIHEEPRETGTTAGRMRGIYPVYECLETGTTRIYGCLDLGTGDDELNRLFPNVPLVMGAPGPQDYDEPACQDRDEQAA